MDWLQRVFCWHSPSSPVLCGRSRPMPLAHGLQPFPGEGPSAHANRGGRCPQMQEIFSTLKTDKLPPFWPGDKFGWESKIWTKNHDSNPNLCCCSARSDILKNRKLQYPFHKKQPPQQVPVSLYLGQVSAPYCKKIFTRAAFPFFAAWCRTGSRLSFRSFFLRQRAKIHENFQDGWIYCN